MPSAEVDNLFSNLGAAVMAVLEAETTALAALRFALA